MGLVFQSVTLANITAIFDRHNWKYRVVDNHLMTAFNDVLMFLGVEEEREIVMLQSPIVPGKGMQGYVPSQPAAERDVAIYLMAVNYRLALGAYTRDHRDGEIRYEISVPLVGSILSDEQIEHMILVTGTTVTVHAPIINAILTGATPLQEALNALDRTHTLAPEEAV
ncbi:MAG TPA: hypothetical protein VGR57_05940 [Ktedonobacterales bacterium]|nr:hypothetical protein [Ktedonobacterales bacterium]